jgi:hypothetical protein
MAARGGENGAGGKNSQQGVAAREGAWWLLVARSFHRVVYRQPPIWTPVVVFKIDG